MIICGFDCETTGLSHETDLVTEIGAVAWDTVSNMPIAFFSTLLKIDRPLPKEIIALTGITDAMLAGFALNQHDGWQKFFDFCSWADSLMAHNAPFDMGFAQKRSNGKIKDVIIDSAVDVPYPETITTRKLTHLAAEHGFVNPFPHRAVTDVLTMLTIASKYNWDEIIANAKTPSIEIFAKVSYEQKDLAKANGFRWNGDRRTWSKNIKQNKLQAEDLRCSAAGFSIGVMPK